MKAIFLLCLTLLSFAQTSVKEEYIKDFHSKLFWKIKPSGYYEVDIGLNQPKFMAEGI